MKLGSFLPGVKPVTPAPSSTMALHKGPNHRFNNTSSKNHEIDWRTHFRLTLRLAQGIGGYYHGSIPEAPHVWVLATNPRNLFRTAGQTRPPCICWTQQENSGCSPALERMVLQISWCNKLSRASLFVHYRRHKPGDDQVALLGEGHEYLSHLLP
jgi:hypothetical protein